MRPFVLSNPMVDGEVVGTVKLTGPKVVSVPKLTDDEE
jgi:hypothetical protein